MNITELAVKRPTAIIMVVALFIGLGILGFSNIGANLMPSGNTPVISVSVTYPGAGANEIEKDIVKPIEDSVAGVSGIDRILSRASDGYCYTILQFNMSTDTTTAVIDIQKAVDSIAGKLPQDADRPVVRKYDINAQAVLILSLSGKVSFEQLYDQANTIKKSLENLNGVGSVSIGGAYQKELDVKLDKTAMDFYGVSANTVISAIKANNVTIPAGTIKEDNRSQVVRVIGEVESISDVEDIRIPVQGAASGSTGSTGSSGALSGSAASASGAAGGFIRLGNIAKIDFTYPENKQKVRLDGESSIGISIVKQSDANIVTVANTVKAQIDKIRPTLIKGTVLTIASDSTTFINSSLEETVRNLIEGIFTTSLILMLFLRRWRSSLIVLIAIPTSLISTCFMMYVMHFTFNIVSLMGLTMCVGILVDDSIVVLENIHRHIQLGEAPIQAAIRGRMEIGLAAIAITLCDVVVFAPVAFMTDLVGQFFREFGLTVVFATLFSLFISFTLTPMLASFMYRHEKKIADKAQAENSKPKEPGRFEQAFINVEKGLIDSYRRLLTWALKNRLKVIFGVFGLMAASLLLIPLHYVNTEFLPSFDQGRILIDVSLTPGSTVAMTDAKTKEVENHLKSLPEIQDFFTTVRSQDVDTDASIILKLKPKSERSKSQTQVATELRNWAKTQSGMQFSVTEPNIVDRTSIDGTKPLILNITGQNSDVLKLVAGKVEDIAKSIPGVVDVENSISAGEPEISVKIDKLATSDFGVTAYDAATTLRTAISGTNAGVFRKNGDEYDIIVSMDPKQIKTAADIGSIKITGASGRAVELSQIAQISNTDSPQEIIRQDRLEAVTIQADLQGRVLGEVTRDMQAKINALQLPYGYTVKFAGDQDNMNVAFDSLIKALIASVLLVYMILVVLYESFLTPVIRMLSLPAGIIGAILILAISGKSLNIMSLIGVIMLDGLASKNGTLLIDYTNTLMKRGIPLREALVEAGTTRLRPILMTSLTMIVGMLPAALSFGDGSEMKSGMAAVLIGGLLTSTLFSPILLPVAYTLIDDLRKTRINKRAVATLAMIPLLFIFSMFTGCSSGTQVVQQDKKLVKVATASIQDLKVTLEYAGRAKSRSEINITSKLSGKVKDVKVDIGSVVKAGDVLFTLDKSEIDAQLRQSQAALESAIANRDRIDQADLKQQVLVAENSLKQAQIQYDDANRGYVRIKSLFDTGSATQQQLDDVMSKLSAAKAQLSTATDALNLLNAKTVPLAQDAATAQVAQAQAALDSANVQEQNFTIVSPVDGVITTRNIDPGEIVSSSVPAFTVIDPSLMYVEVSVPENILQSVTIGMGLPISFDSISGSSSAETFTGSVNTISPQADPRTQLYTLKLAIQNPKSLVKPGMFARVTFPYQSHLNVLAVPNNSLVFQSSISYVYKVDNGIIKRVVVQTDLATDKYTELKGSGINPGDKVVTEGQNFLSDGESVQIDTTSAN